MNNEAMARAYIEDGEYSLGEAKAAYERRVYHRAVRRAQECIEPSLKAILRLVGVEHPREHDVSLVLREVSERKPFPRWFVSALPEIALVSKRLAEERGPAFYGDERASEPPRSIYGENDAKRAIADADKVFSLCRRLFEEWKCS